MLKRVFSIVLVLSVVGLVIGGCGKAEEGGGDAAKPPAETTGT